MLLYACLENWSRDWTCTSRDARGFTDRARGLIISLRHTFHTTNFPHNKLKVKVHEVEITSLLEGHVFKPGFVGHPFSQDLVIFQNSWVLATSEYKNGFSLSSIKKGKAYIIYLLVLC